MSEPKPPFIRRVILRNYKSIRDCDVTLGPLTFLVGPNGSGKSNFLDALRFVGDSLWTTIELAFRERGGIKEVCYHSQQDANDFSVELQLTLPDGREASYAFTVAANPQNRFEVKEEECHVFGKGSAKDSYRINKGQVEVATFQPSPPVVPNRLYLTVASSFPEFRNVYDFLSRMRFYNINPEKMRWEEQSLESDSSHTLLRDGSGAAIVLWGIQETRTKQRIDTYMREILPALAEVKVESLSEHARRQTGDFCSPTSKRDFGDEPDCLSFVFSLDRRRVYFSPQAMSDGTLRAFGVLLALFQCTGRSDPHTIPLVGIEEPENALHPAAAGVLFDAVHEASHFTQVLVTTHSADLLDIKDLDPEALRMVDIVDGETVIGPVDKASRSIMRDRLATAGELLRQNQFRVVGQPLTPVRADTDES